MSKSLVEMDREADKIIAGWTFGSFVGNLLPPPFDSIAVASVLAKMGHAIGIVYGIPISMGELKHMAKAMWSGVGACMLATKVGSDLFKWVPGVNLAVALLIQPPIVAAISWAVGNSFKKYFHFKIDGGKSMTLDEIRKFTEESLSAKVGCR